VKLPRSSDNGYTNAVTVQPARSGFGNRVRLSVGLGENNTSAYYAVRLNKQEVEDLIVMLQFYSKEVWPDET